MKHTIYIGNTLDVLKALPDESVDCIITSPPYWGLRDYGEVTYTIWGGDSNCEHEWEIEERKKRGMAEPPEPNKTKRKKLENLDGEGRGKKEILWKSGFCKKCGAWYGQLGLEPTLDMYIEHLLEITAELKRVLKPTGVMFWNHGDCYSTSPPGNKKQNWEKWAKKGDGLIGRLAKRNSYGSAVIKTNIPKKCLCLQNYRLILKMIDEQEWILRNVIIWHKPNGMPSSVRDRFTNAYEPVFMLVKNKKYWFDLDAVRVPHKESSIKRAKYKSGNWSTNQYAVEGLRNNKDKCIHPLGKNPGDVFAVPYDFAPNILTREEAAYIAGLLDADGCIIIQQKKTNNLMWINITNTDKAVLEWIKDRVGFGKVSERKRNDKWNTIYEYIAYGKNAGALLYAIYPWLQIKKERAKTALEFQSLTVGVGQYLDEGAKERRRQLLEEMHKLNQGEIDKSSSPDPMFYNINGDLWKIPTQPFPEAHFATYPQKLVEPMIKASCSKEGIVLDPFAGSGTTNFVAEQLGRNSIGIELNPEYIKIIKKRFKPLLEQSKLNNSTKLEIIDIRNKNENKKS